MKSVQIKRGRGRVLVRKRRGTTRFATNFFHSFFNIFLLFNFLFCLIYVRTNDVNIFCFFFLTRQHLNGYYLFFPSFFCFSNPAFISTGKGTWRAHSIPDTPKKLHNRLTDKRIQQKNYQIKCFTHPDLPQSPLSDCLQ